MTFGPIAGLAAIHAVHVARSAISCLAPDGYVAVMPPAIGVAANWLF